jgi:septum formation protein
MRVRGQNAIEVRSSSVLNRRLLESVGLYRLEGRGIQPFAHIQGEYFGILGLPLLELLSFLRSRGVLAS